MTPFSSKFGLISSVRMANTRSPLIPENNLPNTHNSWWRRYLHLKMPKWYYAIGMTHLLAEIFKCNEIQPQKSINDIAVAFHGQPSNNIENVFSANSNYRVQYFNDACFLKVQKLQSVHNFFLIYFGSLSNVQAQKTTSGSFQVFENKESEWDAVKTILLVPILVLWIFRSVLIVSSSKQRRLASEMLQCPSSVRRVEGCARLRPNDATDSFSFSLFICFNSQLKNLLLGNWRRTLVS